MLKQQKRLPRPLNRALTQASIGLASQVELELQGGSPERAVPLALEALEHYPYTWQAERALGQAVFENHLRHILPPVPCYLPSGRPTAAVF